jgi:hypothetical protein
MTTNEMLLHANILEKLQQSENNGRGVNCVRTIVHYLRLGDYESALAVRRNEGDKTRAYPKLEKELTAIFGCRAHAVRDCTGMFCK